ncbi:hypothetical protein [Saccharopolyspora griseoalba]|uniref:DUF3558 domain-containing protein n=1 Tax=Saccharopolyspora griseoalba TaxID=1431848 RepID=A0ABW2LHD8_9PSEU
MQWIRITAAAAVLAAVAAVFTSCAGTSEDFQPPGSLAGVDPCLVMSEADLLPYGVVGPGQPADDGAGPGCRFAHPEYELTIAVHEGRNLEYWQDRREEVGLFQENGLGKHKALKLIMADQIGRSRCNQALVVGSGSLNVRVDYHPGTKSDDYSACKTAWDIAVPIEGRLP